VKANVSGFALGALTMYLLDPRQGKRRRARFRDQLVHLRNLSGDAAETTRRDVLNRSRGLVAELRARARHERVDDDILVERVRAKVGRAVSHAHALEMHAHDGVVTVSGPILKHEVPLLLARVRLVRGVRGIDNQLDVREQPGRVPGLQGEGRTRNLISQEWSPSMRALTILVGGGLLTHGLARRSLFGLVEGMAGLGVLLRGVTGVPIAGWVERTILPEREQRGITVQVMRGLGREEQGRGGPDEERLAPKPPDVFPPFH
jgi:hypothetical protein